MAAARASSRPAPRPDAPVFADGSVSLRIYPHNEQDAATIVEQLCEQAVLGTDGGFDGVMTAEHHGGFAGYLPNPLQTTAFQLHAMQRGWAAPCPLLLPLRPTAGVAEEIAWLDARFPGRVGLGAAPGSLALDFEVMGVEQSDAVPSFTNELPRLVAMLSGCELGQLSGDRALQACAEHPVPVVSAAMSPAAVRRAAAAGAGILFDGGSVVERVRLLVDEYLAAGGTGPRVLIRRCWLGAPPKQAFEDQLEVYRSYSDEAALSHWRDHGWICHDDPDALASQLADAVRATASSCLNLRIHAPGIDPMAAREQITVLATEVVPRIKALLEA